MGLKEMDVTEQLPLTFTGGRWVSIAMEQTARNPAAQRSPHDGLPALENRSWYWR